MYFFTVLVLLGTGVTVYCVKTNVICSDTEMKIEVQRTSFSGLDESHLRLSDSTNSAVCSLSKHSNSTHIVAVIPLTACGTQMQEDPENIIFKNEITTVESVTDLITRKHLLEVRFYCQYPKRGNVTLGFTAQRKSVTVTEKGYGTFTYQFLFFQTKQFKNMIDPGSYPVDFELGRMMYMQIEATSSVPNTELFVESCKAAPYDNPNFSPTYTIIENGCEVDPTVLKYSSAHGKQFRFGVKAFKFIGLHEKVYMCCSVMMCDAGDRNSRCSQGCIRRTGRDLHHVKREAGTQSSRHLISQGPIRLRRSAEHTESPVVNLNLNLVFIAGCLLAVCGMICAVLMYKTKMSQVRYQPLPEFES